MASVPFRVYVADDHPVYRAGVVRAIAQHPDLELVGEAGDGRQALAEIAALAPDVAVLDVRLPGLDGTQVLAALRRDGSSTRVVLLSAYVDSAVVYDAVAKGANGYISKDADRQDICEAIGAVAQGETRLATEVHMGLAAEIRAREVETRRILSDREREVLALTAEGLSAPEIAERVHLSPTTVKSHLQATYEKLGVSDRAAAVAVAMRRGLLE
jgi:two-component system, NarL family, nitrate/nitrite response regulator NarL